MFIASPEYHNAIHLKIIHNHYSQISHSLVTPPIRVIVEYPGFVTVAQFSIAEDE